jgi:hypothetical protein
MKGRVLIIAGSDSGGGAGIQADIKAVTALGAFGMTAITALTAQNTLGVHGVLPVPLVFLRQQIAVVLDDLGADALKTGMLADSATIEAVCDEITARAPGLPLVADAGSRRDVEAPPFADRHRTYPQSAGGRGTLWLCHCRCRRHAPGGEGAAGPWP